MIEPEYAARLGYSFRPKPGDRDGAEKTFRHMQATGLRHLRLELGAGEDADWQTWLLKRASESFETIVAFDDAAAFADFSWLLREHGDQLSAVELPVGPELLPPHRQLLGSLEPGKIVLRFENAAFLPTFLEREGTAVLVGLRAVAIAVQPGERFDPLTPVPALQALLSEHGEAPPIWLTGAASEFRQIGPRAQLKAFLDLLSAGADRIYFAPEAGAADIAGSEASTASSSILPGLPGRLLSKGVKEVERIHALADMPPSPAIVGCRPVLVTGGAGFIGANLSDRLANEGHNVIVYDALARGGVERNIKWLTKLHPKRISFALADLRDDHALGEAAGQAQAIFHLAGQVAVTTSMVDPRTDFAVNAGGTLALLEAIRSRNPAAPLIFASTNKVYGDLSDIELVEEQERYVPSSQALRKSGVSEARPLCFHTPYGCSKGAADQYVLDYAHSFGLKTAVLRMSCIYGERQLGTEDQGWVAHFLLKAIAGEPLTIYGDGKQVRDVLHVGNAIDAYLSAWKAISKVSGRAYNLGGGPQNAISLLQLVAHMEDLLGKPIEIAYSAWRPGDQRYFVADTSVARRDLALPDPLHWREGIARLARHFGARPALSYHTATV